MSQQYPQPPTMPQAQAQAQAQAPQFRVPNPQQLYVQTRDTAGRISAAVSEQYLEFRRRYFGEPNPTLATIPLQSEAVQQTEGGKLAARTLQIVPQSVRQLPLVRDLMDHLQWERDIHTLTGRERVALHNLTMGFLYGTDGGIQPWYVEWLLDQMHRVQNIEHPKYYLAYPWHGLLYRSPQELAAFDQAVSSGDVYAIEQQTEHWAGQLISVLRDPLGSQPKLAFSGPHAEQSRILFELKTAAALALGAYLAVGAVRDILGARESSTPPQSAIDPFPPQMAQRMLPEPPPQRDF
jgi:hypothetical protein